MWYVYMIFWNHPAKFLIIIVAEIENVRKVSVIES